MREFTLKNALGDVYRLNSPDCFFHDPEGLGFTKKINFQKMGVMYNPIGTEVTQTPITGRIMFKTSPEISAYRRYLKFMQFISRDPLTLVYQTPAGEFFIDCVVGSVEKTEINSSLGMDIGIEFVPLSLWYQIMKKSGTESVTIYSPSTFPCPCCLKIKKSQDIYTRLTWTQTAEGKTRTGQMRVSLNPNYNTFYSRTDTNPYSLYIETDSTHVKSDCYSDSYFSTERFMYIRPGENVFTCTGATFIEVEGRITYESV